ncbi:MAG: zinc-dependent alcohol dehydrogenase [Candidatus Sericytochromatia bacterium]
MKALVFHKPKDVRVERVEDPHIQDPRDIIVRVSATAICGSDLHIFNGLIPQPRPMVLGHEFMGIVAETGSAISTLKAGDRVVVPFPIACGRCFFCEHQLSPHCEHSNPNYGPEGGVLKEKGGGLFGYPDLYGGYNGGQAEYVRVPFGDIGPRKVPGHLSDEQVLFLTDIFPTGWSAVDWAGLKGGESVAVFGCGPVGIMAQKAAWLQGAGRVFGLDVERYRLAKAVATANAEPILVEDLKQIVEILRERTGGRGPDVCIDAVGMEAQRSLMEKVNAAVHAERGTIKVLEACFSAVRRGGTVSVVGVYGTPYDHFPFSQAFDKGLTLRMGQAPVHKYIDYLLALVQEGRVKLDDVISHRMTLDQAAKAYQIFNDKQDGCVKVVLKP